MSVEPAAVIEQRTSLDPTTIADIIGFVEQVTDADGVNPLDEHVTLHIREGGDAHSVHLVARSGTSLVGYAHLDITDEVDGPIAQFAVHPDYRRHGIGRLIVTDLIDRSPGGRLRLWTHGENSAATHLATSLGFQRSRVLWQMRRSLLAALPRVTLPPSVRIRGFRPGRDDDAWLEVNARAFAGHPDQGRWTADDLRLRMRESWFDPEGFLLAVTGDGADERVVGFHWTKVHGTSSSGGAHGHTPLGEVYVVGIDPNWQRLGLGRTLTIAGLAHLRSRGLTQALLYVDAHNTNAIKVYESLGFVRWDTDVLYAR